MYKGDKYDPSIQTNRQVIDFFFDLIIDRNTRDFSYVVTVKNGLAGRLIDDGRLNLVI